MKRLFSYLSIIAALVFINSCDTTEPAPQINQPGFQKDIPWPSLADSPWPMLGNNPQGSGRSAYRGPLIGSLDWEFRNNWEQIISSVVIGPDSTIYAPYEDGGFIAINPDGTLKWKILEDITHTFTTPIIASDGTIYHFAMSGVFAINQDGSVKWFFPVKIDTPGSNIDKDGNIYFISSQTLRVLNKDGQLIWSHNDPDFSRRYYTSFSPDGKTLYIPGKITAFDIVNREIKWQFGTGNSDWILVDSYGNLFFTAISGTVSKDNTLFSTDPAGKIRWQRKLTGNSYTPRPTMDKNGNLFFATFATDSVFSLDYSGKLRWAAKLPSQGAVTTPLVSDADGKVYVIIEKYEAFDVAVYSSNGSLLSVLADLPSYSGQSPAISFNRLIIPSGKGESIFCMK